MLVFEEMYVASTDERGCPPVSGTYTTISKAVDVIDKCVSNILAFVEKVEAVAK